MQDKYVLPLVDISLLNSPNLDDHMQVAQALDQACKEVGFLYLRGDQFQPALFAQLCDIAKHYFAQDEALKMQNYIGKSVNHSGYVPIGEEQFSSNSYDLKESYDVNYDYQGSALNYPLLGPTQWPDDPAFKRHVSQYYQHLKAIGHQLFRCFALALEQKEDFFDVHIQHAPSQLRLIHYPYNPQATDAEGVGAHIRIGMHKMHHCHGS